MYRLFFSVLFWTTLAASPEYVLEEVCPGTATSINDSGEVAGYFENCAFFWSAEGGLVTTSETLKTHPLLSSDGRVFMTILQSKGWTSAESTHPVCWTPGESLEALQIPKMKESYIQAISSSGHLVIGDNIDIGKSTKQYFNIGLGWESSEIEIHAINDQGIAVGTYRYNHENNAYLLPAMMDLNKSEGIVFQFAGVLFAINNNDTTAGVYLEKGKKRGLHYNIDTKISSGFIDFWFYKVNDSGLGLARPTSDVSNALYLVDFNENLYYDAYTLAESSPIKIVHLYDINVNGDICGVGLKDGAEGVCCITR